MLLAYRQLMSIMHCSNVSQAQPIQALIVYTCEKFIQSYQHFEQLKPQYFTNPVGNPNADSLYKIHLTLWLNTELHRQLDFDYYEKLANSCGISFNYPGNATSYRVIP